MVIKSILKDLPYHAMQLTCIALFGFIISSLPTSTDAEELNSYTITRTSGTITIDGKLDETSWGSAREVALVDTRTGKDVPLKTTIKCLWDDTNLYVGFYCEDPDAWANYTEEDDKLWEEEVVELFIDPDGNGHSYYEHEINPVNAKVDLYVINAGKRLNGKYKGWFDWDFKNIQSEVFVDGDGKKSGTNDKFWVVEVAVPFDDLWELDEVPPKDGDMWRMNLYRIERGKPDDRSDDWYAAFNPTIRASFHTPWKFGEFYFKK